MNPDRVIVRRGAVCFRSVSQAGEFYDVNRQADLFLHKFYARSFGFFESADGRLSASGLAGTAGNAFLQLRHCRLSKSKDDSATSRISPVL
jgi:hypothetical protein